MSRRILAVLLILAAACGAKHKLKQVTLTEGRGTDTLVIGTTTLGQATKSLGSSEDDQSTSDRITELEAPPLRLEFLKPEGGGEAVLTSVITFHKSNPNMPNWEGKTSRGIALLDPVDKMRTAYGEPDAAWLGSPWRGYYYTSGVIFGAQQVSAIPGYKGSATGDVITRVVVTPPFEVEPQGTVQSNDRVVPLPPKTTLPTSPF